MSTRLKNAKRWIVKDAQGRIFGPFVTEQVLEQIDRNYFMGGEMIAPYPGGDWIPITKAPEFYDRLLDALAAEAKGASQSAQRTSARETEAKPAERERTPPPSEKINTHPGRNPDEVSITRNTQTKSNKTRTGITGTGSVIELKNLNALHRIQQIKASRLPLMIIAVGLIVGAGAYFWSTSGRFTGDRIHLLVPRRGQSAISNDRAKDKISRALGGFQTDTFAGYRRAENELVEITESAWLKPEEYPKRAEALSMLCLVYRELWPFAFQDTKDLKAVSEVMREAKRVDPGGMHGAICEIVHMILNGHARDAQGLTDSVLLEKSTAPVLFEIRGDLYLQAKDYQNAAGYFERARTLWPVWQKGAVQEGRARAQMQQNKEAIQLFRDVLGKVSDHAVAKVELGLIEGLKFNQFDKGLDLIKSGVDERIPRPIAARGYLGIAQIYLKKQQKARAAEAAKTAYELDPGSAEAKELLVILGGTGKVKHGETDLMFLGEQYLRAGDYFSAQAQFKAAFDANPKNGIAAMKAGKCLWQLSQTAEGIEWMKKAIKTDPQLVAAYVELADYYAQRFDYFEAIEVLKRAQALQPQGFEVYRGFATVELRRNNFSGALGYGQRALKLYETDIQTFLLMAKAHMGLQQYNEARKFAASALDLDFNEIEAHSLLAKIETGLHGVDSGVSYVQQLLNRYVISQGQQVPQAAIDLRITLGEIYMQDERFKSAEQSYRQALALDPNARRAMVGLGKSLQGQSLLANALESYLKAAVLDPADPEPIFLSGQLYSDTGNAPEALKQFERVLRINPRYPRAHVSIGRVALRRGDAKRALDEAMQERMINPDLADAYILGAEAYFTLKQYTNCSSEYQKAISKKAGTSTTLVRMARCYRLSGALESAESLLREAIAQESGNPDIYKEQGAIFQSKGMADSAITAYDYYLRLAPNATDRNDVEVRIRKIQAGDMSLRD